MLSLSARSRGKGLRPRTLEVFDDLGVIHEVLDSGTPFRLRAGRETVWGRALRQMLDASGGLRRVRVQLMAEL